MGMVVAVLVLVAAFLRRPLSCLHPRNLLCLDVLNELGDGHASLLCIYGKLALHSSNLLGGGHLHARGHLPWWWRTLHCEMGIGMMTVDFGEWEVEDGAIGNVLSLLKWLNDGWPGHVAIVRVLETNGKVLVSWLEEKGRVRLVV